MTYRWLADALLDGAEVVTATERLARELRLAHDRVHASSGDLAWHTARVLPWSGWLRNVLDRCAPTPDEPTRLEGAASAVLWEDLLKEEAGDRVLNMPGLVRQVQQSWQRLQDWRVPASAFRAAAENDDQRLFAAVADRYRQRLTRRGWLDAAQLAEQVTVAIRQGRVALPRSLVYAGFDRLSPAVEDVFQALAEAGCEPRPAPVARHRQTLVLATAADGDAELRAAGAWANRRLAEEPGARIAIVRAGLESSATRCSRLVREGITPGWQYADGARSTAVNVSYGRRLAEYPMVAVALLWLKWVQRGIDSREVGWLLRSPFGAAGSQDVRHRLESALRRIPDRAWTPTALQQVLSREHESRGTGGWLARLEHVATLSRDAARLKSPAEWADRIDTLLMNVGWPGDRVLDSAEFQLRNRWRELLNLLSLFEPVRPQLRFPEAFARLAALASDTIFQPQTDEGLVQLLGPLEAAGLEFDAVWVANLEASQWPAAAPPLSLVSRRLQREAGMPDALPADTLEHARRVLDRLAGCAPSVVLSWPLADHDLELSRSPLLDDLAVQDPLAAVDPGWFASAHVNAAVLQEELQDAAPAIVPGERIRGGAHTVQCQFEEPFTAFATGRLGVREMPAFEVGLSAGLRGRILHDALGRLLQDRPSLGELQRWVAVDLEQRLSDAIDGALHEPLLHADAVLQRLLEFERERLQRLLHSFVAGEVERPDFSVENVEDALTLERHGITLDLRVDRIDRLDDGSLLIIDYKSGAARNLLGSDGEPSEWQTVVYACALKERIGGLVLINLDSRAIVYRGTGDIVPWRPLGTDEWQRRLADWSSRVDDALARLAAGDARIDVALPAQRHRALSLLSRAEVLKRAG